MTARLLDAQTLEAFVDNFLIDRYEERRATPKCHRIWWELLTSSALKVVFAAPRGHGKSTSANHAYGLAAALFQQHPFQIKISKTYKLACEKIEQAKQELLDNEKIKHIFRLKKIIRDREDDFIVEMSDGYRFRMMALGMMQATRGLSWGTMRPTLIQGDDIEDDEEVMNKERRDKAMSWIMKTMLPMGGERTQIRIYGTVLHNDSCLVRLIKMKSWKSAIFEACDEQVTEKSILWPQKFPRQRLLDIKQEYVDAGNIAGFNMEYRNIARDTTSGYFRPEDLIPMGEGVDQKTLTYYVGMDFAISETQRSDYTVLVVAGLDDAGMLYVVDVTRLRTEDGNKIIDEMFAVERAYQPAEWFLEEGAIRKALGAALELRQREEGENGTYLNMRLFTPSKEKTIRAKNIQARIRAKAVRFRTDAGWFPEFADELEQFPRGKHDDQCLVGCTQILMADGREKNLRDVIAGDFVATPLGPKRVLISEMTDPDAEVFELRAEGAPSLRGTAHHPIWSASRNSWVSLKYLSEADRLLYASSFIKEVSSCRGFIGKLQKTLSALFSAGRSIGDTRTPSKRLIDAISRALADVASSTETFGFSTTGRFQTDAKSIMWMATGETMQSETWLASAEQSTSMSILAQHWPMPKAMFSANTSLQSEIAQQSGINQMLVAFGTRIMPKRHGKTAPKFNDSASSAIRRLKPISSVLAFVQNVANMATGCVATPVIRRPVHAGNEAVYNLMVEDASCYYANGILVHNCDALAYIGLGLAQMVTPLTREEEEEEEREFQVREQMTLGRSEVTGY